MRAWKEKILEKFELLQDQARTTWSNLNKREKIILSSALGLLALTLFAFLIKQFSAFLLSPGFSLEANLKEIHHIQYTVRELKDLRMDARRFDRLQMQQSSNFQLNSFIEQEAQTYRVTLKEIKPTRAKSSLAKEKDELYEIQLDPSTSLEASLRFLSGVESALGVRILNLNMKPNYTDPTKLEVQAVIAYSKV